MEYVYGIKEVVLLNQISKFKQKNLMVMSQIQPSKLDQHNLLSDKQHAFRIWHSCETQLTTVITN